jgi:hypothetical protein
MIWMADRTFVTRTSAKEGVKRCQMSLLNIVQFSVHMCLEPRSPVPSPQFTVRSSGSQTDSLTVAALLKAFARHSRRLGISNCPLHFAKFGNFQGFSRHRKIFLSTYGGTIRGGKCGETSNNEHRTPNREYRNLNLLTAKYAKYTKMSFDRQDEQWDSN